MNDNNFDIEMQMEVTSQAYQCLLPPQGRHYWHHLSHPLYEPDYSLWCAKIRSLAWLHHIS